MMRISLLPRRQPLELRGNAKLENLHLAESHDDDEVGGYHIAV